MKVFCCSLHIVLWLQSSIAIEVRSVEVVDSHDGSKRGVRG
jgi:hypothetical protein